jgi:DNA polymerase (family 10)
MTLDNDHIADLFERLADLLEFQGANAFRIRAYRNSSRAIRNQSVSIAQLAIDDPQQLTGIDGIGKGVAEKCVELVETGTLAQLESLLEEIPESVLTLLRIPGLGPRKAALLYQELNISTLDQLQEACRAERVRGLKGFGPKTEQLILRGIQLAKAAGERIYWAEAGSDRTGLARTLGIVQINRPFGIRRQLSPRQRDGWRPGYPGGVHRRRFCDGPSARFSSG